MKDRRKGSMQIVESYKEIYMKIFFTIVFVIFAFGKLIEFFEKKQNNARLEKN